MIGTQYRLASVDAWRRAAHKVADDVMVALVGGKPGFDSRIAFVSDTGGSTRLGIIDQDGAQLETLLSNSAGMESPRIAPSNLSFVYSASAPIPGKPTQAQLTTIMYDLATGSRTPLTTQAQPNPDARFTARWLFADLQPQDRREHGHLFALSLSSRSETRLTDDKAIDEHPAMSPDGTQFTFVSDRGAGQGVYAARVDGAPMRCSNGSEAKACKLTTEPGEHEDPVWSPDGKWIAYARINGEQAAIHVMRADGSEARTLTRPGRDTLDLHPSWSPEGRRIAFYRVAGSNSSVYVLTLAGGEPRKLDAPGDSYEPDWGPKLP